jgi:hypothetical protein
MSDLSPEANQVLNNLAAMPTYSRPTVTSAVAREILLHCDATMMSAGRLLDIKSESLGAGIWRLWLEPRP